MKLYLDTSMVASLHFPSRRLRDDYRAQLLSEHPDAQVVVSRYVVFELARGFVARLCEMHNETFKCTKRFQLLRMLTAKGRGKHRTGATWMAIYQDVFESIEVGAESGEIDSPWDELLPNLFRVHLRKVITAGWTATLGTGPVENPCGCRPNLPEPRLDSSNGHIKHELPRTECGKAGTCDVLKFVRANAGPLHKIREESARSRAIFKRGERKRRVEGIDHLLAVQGENFLGDCCHGAGDGMIAVEAAQDEAGVDRVATKDKDFTGLCRSIQRISVLVAHHD